MINPNPTHLTAARTHARSRTHSHNGESAFALSLLIQPLLNDGVLKDKDEDYPVE